uniref:Uncharacterized protein n=1 Tax=Timema bartmani TaxID=61472 RepID=A0A7R9F2L6_9NEOP|nr:unnamed protein product [Timema bartmani]
MSCGRMARLIHHCGTPFVELYLRSRHPWVATSLVGWFRALRLVSACTSPTGDYSLNGEPPWTADSTCHCLPSCDRS